MFGDNDFVAWPLCEGNQVEKKRVGGGTARKVARLRGGLAGEGGGRNCVSLGRDVELWTRERGGAAEESRCSLALTLLAASVTGPASYNGQPVFDVCVCLRVWRRVNCMDE